MASKNQQHGCEPQQQQRQQELEQELEAAQLEATNYDSSKDFIIGTASNRQLKLQNQHEEQDQQRVDSGCSNKLSIQDPLSSGANLVDNLAIKQQQQPASRQSSKSPGKITHRSQSSPSSLTTHKFGLRPTPSPPRLIIDHNTGDIVESYPAEPTYLRTYQPLDEPEYKSDHNNNNNNSNNNNNKNEDDDNEFDHSLVYPLPQPIISAAQLEEYNRLLEEHYGQAFSELISGSAGNYDDNEQEPENFEMSGHQRPQAANSGQSSHRPPLIPPPHATNKVYFAPPEPTGAGHLFYQQRRSQQDSTSFVNGPASGGPSRTIEHFAQIPIDELQQQQLAATGGSQQPTPLGAQSSSFKRALHKLNHSNQINNNSMDSRTDIAIVTSPSNRNSLDFGNDSEGYFDGLKITSQTNKPLLASPVALATNHYRSDYGGQKRSQQPQPQQQQQQQKTVMRKRASLGGGQQMIGKQLLATTSEPSIEDFNLYNFSYIFRLLLALLLSGLIIYLLAYPLHLDCTKLYRPTYSYVSIIVCCVNLTCLVVFSLFWFANGVTRTLYANLSASAFIIAIYTILVAVNLILGLSFFFINTCHFQKLAQTRTSHFDYMSLQSSNNPSLQHYYNNHRAHLATSVAVSPDYSLVSLVDPQASPIIAANNQLDRAGGNSTFRRIHRRHESPQHHSKELLQQQLEDIRSNQLHQVRQVSSVQVRRNSYQAKQPLDADASLTTTISGAANEPQQPSTTVNTEDETTDDQDGAGSNTDFSSSGGGQDESTQSESGQQVGSALEKQIFAPMPNATGVAIIDPELVNGQPIQVMAGVVSPFEAAWKSVLSQMDLMRRHFYKFLVNYDLKFIGALHALLAVCLMYLAMRVAVVRSHFFSPYHIS